MYHAVAYHAVLFGKKKWIEPNVTNRAKTQQTKSTPTPTEGLGEGGAGVVQTAWALLGLLAGQCKDQAALGRGVRFLMARQRPNGACVAPWFVHTCACIYVRLWCMRRRVLPDGAAAAQWCVYVCAV